MKIVLLGDQHLRAKTPVNRKDTDFSYTWKTKLQTVIDYCNKVKNIYAVIQVGDMFDSPDVSNSVIIDAIETYRQLPQVYCIFGQHDIYGNSEAAIKQSPISILESVEAVRIIPYKGLTVAEICETLIDNINLYGVSNYQSLEEFNDVDDTNYNILVCHHMICSEPLFTEQQHIKPNNLLEKFKHFKLIVCGDYHYRFINKYDNRFIINPGCMIRKSISKQDLSLEPSFIVFDTNTNTYEVIPYNFKPPSEVFDLNNIKEVPKDNSKILDFINNLQKQISTKLDWKEILTSSIKQTKPELLPIYNQLLEDLHG